MTNTNVAQAPPPETAAPEPHVNLAPGPFQRFGPVCDYFGMSRDSGYELARNGEFPIEIVMVGKIMKCRTADVLAFANGSTEGGRR